MPRSGGPRLAYGDIRMPSFFGWFPIVITKVIDDLQQPRAFFRTLIVVICATEKFCAKRLHGAGNDLRHSA